MFWWLDGLLAGLKGLKVDLGTKCPPCVTTYLQEPVWNRVKENNVFKKRKEDSVGFLDNLYQRTIFLNLCLQLKRKKIDC